MLLIKRGLPWSTYKIAVNKRHTAPNMQRGHSNLQQEVKCNDT